MPRRSEIIILSFYALYVLCSLAAAAAAHDSELLLHSHTQAEQEKNTERER